MTVNQVQTYPKGSILFAPGDAAKIVHVVLEGTVVASQGEKQIALGAGGILGDVSFFSDRPHTYHAICATNVTTLNITKSHGGRILSSQPRVALSLLTELAQKVQSDEMMFFQGLQEREETQSQSGFLPEGHPVHSERVPTEYGEYLFTVDVDCPICQTRFTGTRVRTTRLQLEVQKTDLRNVYRNFEPNFFYIWVCPKCLFAYPERQYTRLSQRAITKGREAWQENPPQDPFAFDVPRTIDQAISSYYLAMKSFETIGATLEQWANLWLRLVWIYEDLGEKELALTAAEKAKHYFSEAMSTTSRSESGDQALCLILGELALRLGDNAGAFNSFRAASTMSGGDPRYKRIASDRIADLRERRGS